MIYKLPQEINTVEEVVQQWLEIRQSFIELLDKTPESYFTVVPDYSHWSISHLAEHVYLTQMGIARPFPIVLSGKFGEDTPVGYSLDYTGIYNALQKPSGVKNPDSVAPVHVYSRTEVYGLLDKSQKKLLSVTKDKSKSILLKRGMPHPIFGFMHLFDWLWVMSLHEYSHTVGLKNRLDKLS